MVRLPKAGLSDSVLPGLFRSETDECMLSVLKGHLVIEYAICQLLLVFGEGKKIWKWSFPQKVNILRGYQDVDDWVLDICIDFNEMRNDFCHSLGHEISFEEAQGLAKKWNKLGLEYTDEGMFEDDDYARECYPPQVVIEETVVNLMIYEFDHYLDKNGLETTFGSGKVKIN